MPPISPSVECALTRAGFCLRSTKSAPPRAGKPVAKAIHDPARLGMTKTSCLQQQKGRTMITLYDHIQELRAELRSCYLTRCERAQIKAELARAVAEQDALDRAFEEALAAVSHTSEP